MLIHIILNLFTRIPQSSTHIYSDSAFEVSLNSLVRSDRFVRFVGFVTLRKINTCDLNKFVILFKFQYY